MEVGMGQINWSRVVLGGLLAGLVINISEYVLNVPVAGAEMAEQLKRLNLPPIAGSAIACFFIIGFVIGIVTVWLYAAIRPRYGPGPKTAVCAGLVVWFLAYLIPGIGYALVGYLPTGLVMLGTIWALVEMILAAVAGTWLYKEAAL
jgi:hypothetical protein